MEIKKIKYLLVVSSIIIFQGCTSEILEEVASIESVEVENLKETFAVQNLTRWNFNSLDGWVDGSQNMNGTINYSIEGGKLNMFTRANTFDRPKVRTKGQIYNEGKYTWRVFVPEMGIGDQASIGAFLYSDDTHELDFEIGYGTSTVRQNLNAASDDLIVYTTSQGNPFQSIPQTIKRNQWYTLEIDLILVNNTYVAIWYVNGLEIDRLNLNYGDQDPFYIFCSVENLTFLGDHIPAQNNYALFDYVEFDESVEPSGALTFNVDLNPKISGNSIRIAANPGGTWQGDYIQLEDSDGDGIYSGTVTSFSTETLLFRVYEGPAGSSGWTGDFISDISQLGCPSNESEGANYEVDIVQGMSQIIDVAVGKCLLPSITFNVDLSGSRYPTILGNSIRIVANPGGTWQGDYIQLEDSDGDGIYSGTVTNFSTETLLFRVYEGPAGSAGWTGDFISDISQLGCPSNESEGANYEVDIVQGMSQIIDVVLGKCL